MTYFERGVMYCTSIILALVFVLLLDLARQVVDLKQTYHGMIQENVIDTHNRDMRLMNDRIERLEKAEAFIDALGYSIAYQQYLDGAPLPPPDEFAPVEATMRTMMSSESIGILPTRIEAGQ